MCDHILPYFTLAPQVAQHLTHVLFPCKAPHVIKQRFVLAEPELGLYVISFFKEARWQEVRAPPSLHTHVPIPAHARPHPCTPTSPSLQTHVPIPAHPRSLSSNPHAPQFPPTHPSYAPVSTHSPLIGPSSPRMLPLIHLGDAPLPSHEGSRVRNLMVNTKSGLHSVMI